MSTIVLYRKFLPINTLTFFDFWLLLQSLPLFRTFTVKSLF
jgi:hypothetical protein